MRHPIRRFIILSLIAALPVWVLVGIYLAKDPFYVIYSYDDACGEKGDSVKMGYNAGNVALANFEHYRDSLPFDSFIFGSSMSQNYKAEWWAQHLPAGAQVYHFDAASEHIEGILNKVRFLDKQGVKIANALIVIEEEMLWRVPNENNFLFVQPPRLTPHPRYLNFHTRFFNVFKNPYFLGYTVMPKQFTQAMLRKRYLLADNMNRIPAINESYYAHIDSVLDTAPEQYFTPELVESLEWPVATGVQRPYVMGAQAERLQAIADILHKQGTNYLVIIPPRYHRPQLLAHDLHALQCIFGAENVQDFSHDERMANDRCCYYDHDAHLAAKFCKVVLDSAYALRASTLPSPYTQTAKK